MNPLQLWRLWRLEKEVKKMDQKAILKIVVCALLAAATVAGTQFLGGAPVDLAAVGSAAVAAVIAYMQKQPHV